MLLKTSNGRLQTGDWLPLFKATGRYGPSARVRGCPAPFAAPGPADRREEPLADGRARRQMNDARLVSGGSIPADV